MSRAGNSYTDVATAFIRDFPIDTTISVVAFDSWGIRQKEISPVPFYAEADRQSPEWIRLVVERNDLRRRINAGAVSEAFAAQGSGPAFAVDVITRGEDYFVRNALDSYEDLAARLPELVYKLATTKRRRIQRLKTSIDFERLPPQQQLGVLQLDKHIRTLMRSFQRNLDDFNEEYAIVQEEIKQLDLESHRGGLIAFDKKPSERYLPPGTRGETDE